MKTVNLALVTSGNVGWRTVRQRWERDLADCEPSLHHIENHNRALTAMSERFGARSVGLALAGRSAARAALEAGAGVVLLSTLQNAPFVPLRNGVVYIVYGDCTTAQLAEVYGGRKLRFPGSMVARRMRRLVEHGAYFLCMSDWYRKALREEFAIPDDRLVLLPFYVDTNRWKPARQRPRNARKRVLFLGGDLMRKGGDVIYELSAQARFRNVEFHIVSGQALGGAANLVAHRAMKPDSPELIDLVASCDLMLAPTRADASPISVLEAAACGVACIATRVGALPEIVMDGVTGSLLDRASADLFGDELAAWLDEPQRIALRGANARHLAERCFSREAHVAGLRRVIAKASAEAAYQQSA